VECNHHNILVLSDKLQFLKGNMLKKHSLYVSEAIAETLYEAGLETKDNHHVL